ncbi:TPA: hypothetical protein JFB80_005177 [Escherichia coli]|nr:hypothetical protein [Escherichia coli]
MGTDYLAAKMEDPLEHTSVLGDFMGGLVEGVCYGVLFCASANPVGLAVGLTAGFIFSDVISEIGDTVSSWFPPDVAGTITSGSKNVNVKSKPAARAAGAVPDEILLALLEAEAANPPDSKGMQLVKGIVAKSIMIAKLPLLPAELGRMAGEKLAAYLKGESTPSQEDEQGFWSRVWESISNPVVDGPDPALHVETRLLDTIDCHKHRPQPIQYLAEGSETVRINSQPACRNGDRSTCEAVIAHTQASAKVRIGGRSLVVKEIHTGKNMLAYYAGLIAGGFLVSSVQALFCRTTAREFAGKLPCLMLGSVLGNTLGIVAGGTLSTSLSSLSSGLQASSQTARPVHIASGVKILGGEDELDFACDGLIPLAWQRIYSSLNDNEGILGRGWCLPFEVFLHQEPAVPGAQDSAQIFFHDMSGRELGLGDVPVGGAMFYVDEGFRLYHPLAGMFVLESAQGQYQIFEADPLHDGRFRLIQVCDRHLNGIRYYYNDRGLPVRIEDDLQAICLHLDYHPQHSRLTAVYQQYRQEDTLPGVLRIRYEYNEQVQLTAVVDADGVVMRRFAWDEEHGRLAMHQTADGLQAHYRWQPTSGLPGHFHVARHWLQEGERRSGEILFDYDPAARRATLHYGDGRPDSLHEWDEQYNITRWQPAPDICWLYEWGDNRELLRVVDPAQCEYGFKYDERGNLIQVVDPVGQEYRFDWDRDFAFPLKEEYPEGLVLRHVYNVSGDRIKTIDQAGLITRYNHDASGLVESVQDARGNLYRYAWNNRGQLTRQTDCSGYTTHLYYDEYGRLAAVTDAQGNCTRQTFSAAGRLQKQIRPDGGETTCHYNARGQLAGVTDPARQSSRFDYNLRGQVIRHTDPQQRQVRFEYDAGGQLIALYNQKNEAYRFSRDSLSRLEESCDLTGCREVYRYDSRSHVSEITRYPAPAVSGQETFLPQVTRLAYDAAGRVQYRENGDGAVCYRYGKNTLSLERFAPDDWQKKQRGYENIAAQDTLHLVTDAYGSLLEEHNPAGIFTHRYDELGNRTETQMPDGRRLKRLYYGSGHLQQLNLEDNDGQQTVLAEFERNSLHQEISRTQGSLTLRTEYDAAGRITARLAQMAQQRHGTPLLERRYSWDQRGFLMSRYHRTQDAQALLSPEERSGSTWYQYDCAGQILSAQQHFTVRQYCDLAGNLMEERSPAIKNNQLMQYRGWHYQYDAFGRMSRRTDEQAQRQDYRYNSDNRMVEVRFADRTHSRWQRVEYDYDLLGRRTGKRLYRWHDEGEAEPAPERVRFIWDGMRLRGEDSPGKATEVLYVYNGDSYEPLARVDRFTRQVIEPQDTRPPKTTVYYYHTALNGLPEAMTSESGQLVYEARYELWGKETEAASAHTVLTVGQNLRFAGQYFDAETGLHYNTFRFYAPECGRFTQPDPIGLRGGLNLYSYVPNPLSWIDPLGLKCWSTEQKNYWKDVGAKELTNPSGLYSPRNILEMIAGRAPKFTARVKVIKTGKIETRDIPYELHHKNIPQRQGGPGVHNKSNLDEVDPWQHQDTDKYRHSGIELIEVITGVNSW